jgi:hypothetical protein
MFRFEKPEDGSAERFDKRIEVFKQKKKPVAVHHFWWFVHNCVAHPLIGVLPFAKWTFRFHDWTSHRINAE